MEFMDEKLSAEFRENGAVKLTGFLDEEALRHCRFCFDEIIAKPDHKLPPSTYKDRTYYNPSTGYRGSDDLLRGLLDVTPFTAAVQKLWNTSKNVWLYDHETFNKAFGGGVVDGRKRQESDCITPFHQDTRVIAFAGEHLANIWIPFEDLPAENALQCVKGSHHGPLYDFFGFNYDVQRPSKDKPTPKYNPMPEFPPEQVLKWDMKRGDVIVLHTGTIHGGGPVGPECPVRNTLVLRFFGDKCFYNSELGAYSDDSSYSKVGGLQHGDHFSKAYPEFHLLGPGISQEMQPALVAKL